MTTMAQVRMRGITYRASLKYEVYLTPGKDHRIIRDWCNESIGDCHLLWSADLPDEVYTMLLLIHNRQ